VPAPVLGVVVGPAPSAAAEADADGEVDVGMGATEVAEAVGVPDANADGVLLAEIVDVPFSPPRLNEPVEVFSVLLVEGAPPEFDVAEEVAEGEVEDDDGGWLILMFLIVNLPDALPLSPKRTRMYVLRVVTEGTVISARPFVMGKSWARG